MSTLIRDTALTFSDVLIVPQYSEVESRSDVDTTSNMGKFKIKIPVISANMRDITGKKMCIELAELGAMGILHRFMTIEENMEAVNSIITQISLNKINKNLEEPAQWKFGVSVGVKEEEKDRFFALYDAGARIFTIDIAHGDSLKMKKMVEFMRNSKGCRISVIAGNIATKEAAKRLINLGVDILKVGIGGGAVCKTRSNAGVGVPQLTAIKEIYEFVHENGDNIKIISDGGIKLYGDIAKALVYSDAVMVGSMISGTSETPGNVFENEKGEFYKTYGGSASGENKIKSNNENKFVEGMVKTVPFRGHVKYIIRSIHDGLRSAFSYSGASKIEEFKENVVLRTISSGGKAESKI